MSILLALPVFGLSLLAAVLLARTRRFSAQPRSGEDIAPLPPGDTAAMAGRLAQALRFATVSHEDPGRVETAAFEAFQNFLREAFPRVHAALELERVGDHALLYRWPGSEPALRPALLLAHQDVVPVAPGTEPDWSHPPFAGEVAGGYIWGRGALDDKSSLMGILEAVEGLFAEGFRPRRTVYLAFGHDEEVGGTGAAEIAGLLRARGVRLECVLDEGGFVTEGIIPGVSGPVALVGIAEKGYLTIELSVPDKGGHSSMPARPTAVGILARALVRLEKNPFPADLTFSRLFFKRVGPRLPFPKRLALANLWLFAPLVERWLSRLPEMDAGIRTTIAPTMLAGGVKENVLPLEPTAVVNLRLMPGEETAAVLRRVERVIADPRVRLHPRPIRSEPSPVSDIRSAAYRILEESIRQSFPAQDLIVAPYLVVGATDSRHFNALSESIFRFSLVPVRPGDLQRVHGTDERLGVEDYARLVGFYNRLLRNLETLAEA